MIKMSDKFETHFMFSIVVVDYNMCYPFKLLSIVKHACNCWEFLVVLNHFEDKDNQKYYWVQSKYDYLYYFEDNQNIFYTTIYTTYLYH
jgi:hypothetical protein